MRQAYHAVMAHIDVTPDTRRRVLDRLAEEAPARAGAVRFPGLKRYLSAAACFALLLTGAVILPRLLHRSQPEPPPVAVVPKIVEAGSLQELSELVGFPVTENFSLPFPVEETVCCSYWNEMAQVTYRGGGYTAVYRQSAGTGDNSGDYNVYGDVVEIAAGGLTVTLKGDGGSYSLAVWTDGTYAYSLSLTPGAGQESWQRIWEAHSK